LTGPPATAKAADRLAPLDPRQVQVGGEIGRRIDLTVQKNILALDVDKDFIRPFKEPKAADGFVGLGMFLDAVVRLAAYTGDPKLIELKRHIVREALAAQQPDGYLGMIAPAGRMWRLWDIHEMGYLIYGLTGDYRFFKEASSLAAARKLADYVLRRWREKPDWQPDGITVHMAVTGLERTLLTLSDVTGDPRYRKFCMETRRLREWDLGIVKGRRGLIEGHAYAYFAHCLAQLHLNRTEPGESLLRPTQRALDFVTKRDGLAITGTCGDHECWHDTQSGSTNLGETCATAYLLRILDDRMRADSAIDYGDVMERAIYNALFAAQSPDGRRIRYYTPFECPRVYFPGDTYCCPNNFRRIVSELPSLVYYRLENATIQTNAGPTPLPGVVVNLYTPSTATLDLPGGVKLTLKQETDYPSSGEVLLNVSPSKPAEFTVLLRIPRWSRGGKVLVNDQPAGVAVEPGKPAAIHRRWQQGDRVRLSLPMEWRLVKGRKAQSGRVAVMRGPVLFCLSHAANKELAGLDLRLLTLKPDSLEKAIADNSIRPGGLACKAQVWKPGTWYPSAPTTAVVLREFVDPDGELAYLHVPNPVDPGLVDDELTERH
jgi:hypothetical protein